VAPLLATADEVASGTISHAMRFALPNDMLQHHVCAFWCSRLSCHLVLAGTFEHLRVQI
jgi:hypothetical protein